jgi:transcription initiation factor TFIID TATA-box-binding protein
MPGFGAVTTDDVICHNVLAHAQTHCNVELRDAIKIFRNAEFDPAKFSCVRVRYWKPACTISVFANGKLQATGAKTIEDARLAMKMAAYRLLTIGGNSKVRFTGFRAENILATLDLGQPMNLLGLSRDRDIVSTYEPTRFSAVVVRDPTGSGVTVDVFSTGKVNLKGSGSLENLCTVVSKIMHVLERHVCEKLE